MPALGQVDPDPDGVVEGLQRERPRLSGRVEEPREGGPVEQRDPVREDAPHIPRIPHLPLPRVEFPQQRLLPGVLEPLAQRGHRPRRPVEQLTQLRYGGEAAVDGPERAEELGEHGGGPAGVAP